MAKKTKKIQFPFEPNEIVKAAFRDETQMKIAIKMMTEALANVAAAQCGSPFDVVFREYPELIEIENELVYCARTKTIDIKKTDWKRR